MRCAVWVRWCPVCMACQRRPNFQVVRVVAHAVAPTVDTYLYVLMLT